MYYPYHRRLRGEEPDQIIGGKHAVSKLMQITFNIETEQLIEAASKMPLEDKLRLYDRIKDDIFDVRFRDILKSLKTDELSNEDILQEVEHVRSERYKNCR